MFKSEITRFNQNMDTIRGYIDSVEPVLLEKISENLKKDAEDLSALILLFNEPIFNDEECSIDISDEIKEKVKQKFGGDIVVEPADNELGCTLNVIGPGGKRFTRAISKFYKLENQKILLYRSSLMSIVSTVECFFLDLLQVYFKEYPFEITPALISKKDKHFTLEEIEAFSDIKDARAFLIDDKLENLLRGSFDSWIDFLKEKLNLGLGYIDDEKENLIEIFQRRNIVVHNKGIVNSIYLSKVSERYKKVAKKGHPIYIDRKYLDDIINKLELCFSLIAFEIWKKKDKDDEARYSFLSDLISTNLDLHRWEIVRGYSIFLANDACSSNWYKTFARINMWLSIKKLGSFEKIKDSVQKEDFSACTTDFQACKCALLEDFDNVYKLSNQVLESGMYTFDFMMSWPIFDDFKKSDKFNELKAKFVVEGQDHQKDQEKIADA